MFVKVCMVVFLFVCSSAQVFSYTPGTRDVAIMDNVDDALDTIKET
jgi:hypothetical protein